MKPRNDTSVLKCLKESKQTIYICYKFGGENTRTPIGLSPSRAFLFWTVRNPSVEREEHGEAEFRFRAAANFHMHLHVLARYT